MKKYNLSYISGATRIEKHNINEKELYEILDNLPREESSSLRVTKIDEDELER